MLVYHNPARGTTPFPRSGSPPGLALAASGGSASDGPQLIEGSSASIVGAEHGAFVPTATAHGFALRSCAIFDVKAYPSCWVAGFYVGTPARYCVQVINDAEQLRNVIAILKQGGIFVGYNSSHYDLPVIRAILAGRDPYSTSQELINQVGTRRPAWLAECPELDLDHIHLAARLRQGPSFVSLTVAAASLEMPELVDLPFPPDKPLTVDELQELSRHNLNVLLTKWRLLEHFAVDLAAMAAFSQQVGFDARSMTAQKAGERLLENAFARSRGRVPIRMSTPTSVYYYPPSCVHPPSNPFAAAWFERVNKKHIKVEEVDKKIKLDVQQQNIRMGDLSITLGQGGLHTRNEPNLYYADEQCGLCYIDAASYYPSMIAAFGYMPRAYGQDGLQNLHPRFESGRRLSLNHPEPARPQPTKPRLLLGHTLGQRRRIQTRHHVRTRLFPTLYGRGALPVALPDRVSTMSQPTSSWPPWLMPGPLFPRWSVPASWPWSRAARS
jgi:hypothetical protein